VGGVLDYRLFQIGDTSVTAASLVATLLILAASYLLARLSRKLVSDRLLARTHLSIGVRYMLGRFTGYLVFVLGALVALQTIGIRATTLTAFGAALGVGIGFGLQDIVKNFVAGLVILIERPFQVGDRIEIDKVAAEVFEIRSRATILRTNDDVHLIVPNSRFINDIVVNRSYDRLLYRCRAPVSVDNASDPRAVADALLEAARRCEGVLEDPAASVRFRGFGEAGLNFELLCWTDKMAHRPGALVSSLNFEIHEALRRRDIRLPQTEIRVRGAEELSRKRGLGASDSPGTEAAEVSSWEAPR
jgi:small-conductance mechanosensitive channel